MSELQPFVFPETGQRIRSVVIDGIPWFVARDVAAVLGYANGNRDVARHTSEGQRREYRIGTAGGVQTAVLLNEPGVYRLIMRSNMPKAVEFQDWLAGEVLPALRQHGSYSVERRDVPTSLPEALRAYADEVEARQEAELRAEAGEQFKRAIEAGDGLSIRAFHKKYFSGITESEFFAHLYKRGYLINQRGKGGKSPRTGRIRDGSQHRHPGHKGKPWLYLHTAIDNADGRREHARVRPGRAELDFRDRLAKDGLTPNETTATELERI